MEASPTPCVGLTLSKPIVGFFFFLWCFRVHPLVLPSSSSAFSIHQPEDLRVIRVDYFRGGDLFLATSTQGFKNGFVSQAGGALCPDGLCCSNYGWCGSTDAYCAPENCQSQCPIPSPAPPPSPPPSPPPPPAPAPPPGQDITDVIDSDLFDEILLHRNNIDCPGKGFYTFDAFVAAARIFPGFAVTGNSTMHKTEVASFLAQTSHETTGGWPTAPDGPYAWGYCFISDVGSPGDYCVPNEQWPCVPGKKYYGRGPIQLSYNYNYGPAGEALGLDLLGNPDLVGSDPVVAFRTAIWFWMTEQFPKPSCHDVIIGKWIPSAADQAAGRVRGYGVITNIINGGLECGHGPDERVISRIGFYERYCNIFGVNPGDNLDCFTQQPFGWGLKLSNAI